MEGRKVIGRKTGARQREGGEKEKNGQEGYIGAYHGLARERERCKGGNDLTTVNKLGPKRRVLLLSNAVKKLYQVR